MPAARACAIPVGALLGRYQQNGSYADCYCIGELTAFSAWSVEAREPDQLLLRDFQGRTRSWLMTGPSPDGTSTRLLFGSAVAPAVDRLNGKARMGLAFRALLGFHKLYSRILLNAAARRLAR